MTIKRERAYSPFGSRFAIERAPRRLQVERVGRVALDLAAQSVHLHVDGSFLRARSRRRERLTGDAHPGSRAQQTENFSFALGEPDDFLAVPQLATFKIEDERSKAKHGFFGAGGAGSGAAQDRGDAEQQFPRFIRFAKVVVDAGLEAADAIDGVRSSGKHENRNFR